MGLGSDAVRSGPGARRPDGPGALEEMLARAARGADAAGGGRHRGEHRDRAFDPLDAVADVCGARGRLAARGRRARRLVPLSPALRGRLRGIERADSVAWDPHKMMWMPISAGAVLVRERRHLDAAFRQSAPYLFHLRPGEERSATSAG
jgi:L-2,4-diaminobutyrate decarboxylase